MIVGAIVGVFVANPSCNLQAFTSFNVDGQYMFPILFVTIACGAVSGFHSLVSSGTASKQIKNEKNLAYTNATPAMGQPGNPYVNPVTGQPYDAGVVNPVTGQAYNQTPDAGYGQAPNQTYNQTPDGAPSVPYTPGQNTDNNPYS